MLQLQQLSLRNELQVIVTSHSPVVLDSVPANGRIFLERDEDGQVTVRPPYRDVIQNALYGRSGDAFNLLCEDDAAEGILRGVFDILLPKQGIRFESVRIGRNTGANEFAAHAAAFKKFGQIKRFIFVLDGDKRGSIAESKLRDQVDEDSVLFLPGGAPEVWLWEALRRLSPATLVKHGFGTELKKILVQLDTVYESASDSPAQIAKTKLYELAEAIRWSTPEIARVIGRLETENLESEIQPLTERLETALLQWRATDS